EVRVRNVKYRGDWPKKLPADLLAPREAKTQAGLPPRSTLVQPRLTRAAAFFLVAAFLTPDARGAAGKLPEPVNFEAKPTLLRVGQGEVLSVAYSPDGEIVATGGEDKAV